MPKNAEIYVCKKCNFKCSKKSNYDKHCATLKHKRITMDNQKMPVKSTTIQCQHENDPFFQCQLCNKKYKYMSGLSKHKKTCNVENIATTSSKNITENDTSKLILELLNQNKELQETLKTQQVQYQNQINEILPKVGNNTINNNRFNLQVFLNEKCKDAINFTDFVDSLQIQLEDLKNTKNNGLVSSISSLLISGLNDMDIYKRPIHCTDPKREILYIKDSEKWEKDNEKDKLKMSINEIANKQRLAMKEWTKANPNWQEDEKLKDEYVQLLHKLMEPLEHTEKEQNKIIKKVSAVTCIDKEEEDPT